MTLQLPKSKAKNNNNSNSKNKRNAYDNINAKQIIINVNTLEKLNQIHQTYGSPLQESYSEIIESTTYGCRY